MHRRCRAIMRDVEVLTRGSIETSRSRVRDIAGDLARCVIAVLWDPGETRGAFPREESEMVWWVGGPCWS